MKLGIYSPYLDTLTGGELYMLTIAEFLSKENDVDVFWDDGQILEKASKRFNLDLSKVNLVRNIFDVSNNFYEKFVKTLKYDKIIYLSDGSLPILAPKKLIVHFQFPLLKSQVSNINRRKIILAKKVICNSKFTKSFIDKTYSVKSVVLYPPAQKITVEGIKKENIILTVGRYQPYGGNDDFKKLKFMIDTFKKFEKENKDWKFFLVTSVRKKDCENFERELGSLETNSIRIIKNADFNEVGQIYAKAKIYWHAAGFGENLSKNPERAEHFGMSTVEAMSAGCVPVVINLGGQKEIVVSGENGYLWDTESELLNLTKKLVDNKQLLENMSKEAKKIIDFFGKEKFCKELDEIVNKK